MGENQNLNFSEDELKKKLTEEEYNILRRKGTEIPFSGEYWNNNEKGIYFCKVCGQKLFSSDTKFNSGTGWPSFTDSVNRENIDLRRDASFGMERVEVVCKKCGSHLGHVFNDGPKEKGSKRYCINSACLDFKKE